MAVPLYTETLTVKKEMMNKFTSLVSIDAGCSQTKVLCTSKDEKQTEHVTLIFATFPRKPLDETLEWLTETGKLFPGEELRVTGLCTEEDKQMIEEKTKMKICLILKTPSAKNRGIQFLLNNFTDDEICYGPPSDIKVSSPPPFLKKILEKFGTQGDVKPKFPCIFATVGDDLKVMKVPEVDDWTLLAWSPVGIRSIAGISQLLTGLDNFEDVLAQGMHGDRGNTDLQGKDMAGTNKNSPYAMDPEMPMMSFGKPADATDTVGVENYKKEDMANSMINLLTAQMFTLFTMPTRMHKIFHIYIEGQVAHSPLFRKLIFERCNMFGANRYGIHILKTEHTSAIGALLA